MTTRTQIAEWEKSAAIAWHTDDNISNFDVVERGYIQGYIRARTEQATEIAELERLVEHYRNVFYTAYEENTELKAKLAEVNSVVSQALNEMHHAYFKPNWFTDGKQGATQQFLLWHGKAEATIEQLLKD
jgi:ribosomal protein S17E